MWIGLDIGGTKLLACAAGRDGRVVGTARAVTPAGLDEGLEVLHRLIAEVAAGEPITAIGASAGGPLDYRTGVVSPLHQPAWRDVPLGRIMTERYKVPFAVDVDTNAAVLAEYRFGTEPGAAPPERLLYLTLSTGMGGGFCVGGHLYRGAAGQHPEVGHIAVPLKGVPPDRVRCACGASDCLEALVSGRGIERVYGKPADRLSDPEWASVGHHLGLGLRNLATTYAPDVIALGGGVATGAGDRLLTPARATMNQGLRLVRPPAVRLSALGYDTALHGAVELARRATP